MNKSSNKIAILSGTVLALSAASGVTMAADTNPFGMTELSGGYNLVVADAKCGGMKSEHEAKCGGNKAKEAKCGGEKAKEAKCGGNKAMNEAKCGGEKKHKKEGKCGEAKCGGNK